MAFKQLQKRTISHRKQQTKSVRRSSMHHQNTRNPNPRVDRLRYVCRIQTDSFVPSPNSRRVQARHCRDCFEGMWAKVERGLAPYGVRGVRDRPKRKCRSCSIRRVTVVQVTGCRIYRMSNIEIGEKFECERQTCRYSAVDYNRG